MAEIMVSSSTGVMNSLLGKLAILAGERFARMKELRKEVKFINDELISMKVALERLSDLDELDPQTKMWSDIVRDMSYDIEDTIDDFMQNIGENNITTGFVSNTARRLKNLWVHHRFADKIEDIKKRLLETSARRQRYMLDIPPTSNVAIDPRVAALYQNVSSLVGVEGPAKELTGWLQDEEQQLKVVSIVGFGGLGKTTLANVVYSRLKDNFNGYAFVPVSQRPDIPKLMRSLLFQFKGRDQSFHDYQLHDLLKELREHLQKKRYLIIIDDIWDVQAWEVIKCAFPDNDLGSRVITTTRIHEVAKACCSRSHEAHGHIFEMKPLRSEYSRKLFFDRIFSSEEACPRQLRDISVKILERCGGLPLAIISISSMLACEGKEKIEIWEHVGNSMGSETNLTLSSMRQILNLSYKDLPCHLKTCLMYIGMYPEDYTIERSELERQWMAEGFISKGNGKDMAKVARNYFNELVNRSLIQPVELDNRGSVTQCKMHDMMLDLILLKSAEQNFFTIVDDPMAFIGLKYKPRRLSIRLDGQKNTQTILPCSFSKSQIRSAMFFGSSENTPPLSEFKFLRVLYIDLDLETVDLTGLCKLYQLRYLWFGYHCSYQLPKEIKMLQHLETLYALEYNSFPSDFLMKFLMVDIRLPDGISNIKSLQLDNITGLGELTNLRYLILGCRLPPNDRERRMDALCSSLGRLHSLEELLVNLTGCIDGLMPSSPPPTPYHLERLILSRHCWFSMVPSWMGVLRNLSELECKVGELLNDAVGILAELPVLTDLDLKIHKAPNEMIVMYEKAFPALRRFKLQLSSASYLIFLRGTMPKLQRLKLRFGAKGSEQNMSAPAGIEHLLALEEISAEISWDGATESEKTNSENALRSA